MNVMNTTPSKCPVCDRWVGSKPALGSHMKIHKSEVAEVAAKVMQGLKLTEREFDIGRLKDFWSSREIRYEDYLRSMYEDDVIRGQLCGNVAQERTPSGTRFCAFGIHASRVKPTYLTDLNRSYLRSFGWTDDQIGSGDAFQTPKGERTVK